MSPQCSLPAMQNHLLLPSLQAFPLAATKLSRHEKLLQVLEIKIVWILMYILQLHSPTVPQRLCSLVVLFSGIFLPLLLLGVAAVTCVCATGFLKRFQQQVFASFPSRFSCLCPSLFAPLPSHLMIWGDWQPPQRVRAGTDGIWMVHSCMKKAWLEEVVCGNWGGKGRGVSIAS